MSANWTVLDPNTWGVSSTIAASGSYSAWCLGNNSYRPYPDDYRARMRRGPYDLSGSTGQTVLRADLWVESEYEFDYAKMLVSTDGANYYGLGWSGNAAFWRTKALDLTNVYTLGDVSKSPNLYVMLAFQSDESESEGNGVYFDNVRLEDLGNPQPDLVSNSLSGSSSGPAGSAIPITDTIANQGSAEASATYASYYLSSDTNITNSDIYLGSRAVSSLPAGGTDSATTTFTVPAGASGTYYVGTIVDSSDNVSESLEDNNARAGNTVAIPSDHVPYWPDLSKITRLWLPDRGQRASPEQAPSVDRGWLAGSLNCGLPRRALARGHPTATR